MIRDKTEFGEVVRFQAPAKLSKPPKFDPDHEWIRDERLRAQTVAAGLSGGRLWCINGRKLAEPPSPRDLQFFEEEGEDE